jgi:hypothetical protein
MSKLVGATGVFALGMLCCSLASGQAQETPRFSRDACVKVRDGKGSEYAAFLRDVTAKVAKVRVDEGYYASYTITQAVAPAGQSARCDYHLVTSYIGFPPESAPERLATDLERAGVKMSVEAMIARRNELTTLVSMDTWRWHERVGTFKKGSYARLNYYKVQAGMMGEWTRMESTGWKKIAEAMAGENPGMAWRVATLSMPGGVSLPYNAMTVDVFPSWAALGKGIPARATWNKVHPNTDMSAYMERLGRIVERPRVDIVRIVEMMEGK